jgi:predicted RNase H-like nuclease (RuvC/YqgF family)
MGVREALKTQMVENAKSKEIIIELETAWLR